MKFRMGELTAAEMREVRAASPVILLPLGSHEDQGPHAPMGDYLAAEAIAVAIAERASERGVRTLVAPVLPFGGADYFGSVPGGLALSSATLRAVLDDLLTGLLRHQLRRLIILNGHAGNVPIVHEATQLIYRRDRVLIPNFYLWRIAYELLAVKCGPDAIALAGHGADPLTSINLKLFPQWTRPDLVPEPQPAPHVMGLPVTTFGSVRFEGVEVQVPVEVDEIAPNGVCRGDPRASSAERGALLIEHLTEIGARFVSHFSQNTASHPT